MAVAPEKWAAGDSHATSVDAVISAVAAALILWLLGGFFVGFL